jgi:hypothetical protein
MPTNNVSVPAVAQIEGALDQLAARPDWLVKSQLTEFHSLGENRLGGAGVDATDPKSLAAAEQGYLIGLETARYLLATRPAAVANGVMI